MHFPYIRLLSHGEVHLLTSHGLMLGQRSTTVVMQEWYTKVQILSSQNHPSTSIDFFSFFFLFLFLTNSHHKEFLGQVSDLNRSCDYTIVAATPDLNIPCWARDGTYILGTAEMLLISLCHSGNSNRLFLESHVKFICITFTHF